MTSPELDKPAATPSADEQAEQRRLLAACQLLLDPIALRVLGALAQRPQTPVALAAATALEPAQVFQRLAQLQQFDLVAEEAQTYRFRAKSLAPLRRALGRLNRAVYAQAPAASQAEAADAAEQRLLAHFIRDGRLVELPTHPRKLLVVLRWLASHFEQGRRYSEREVNAVMLRYHEDYATLRRELINHMLMARDNEAYWRLPDRSDA
jgi:hypothetical protein